MSTATVANADLSRELGVYVQPGVGTAYPDLAEQLLALYRERVARLAFVPAGWLSRVTSEVRTSPPTILRLVPATPNGGPTLANLPAWLTGDRAAAEAWQDLAIQVGQVVAKYAAAQAEAGALQLAALRANATWWDGLYRGAVAIRDLPGNVVAGVGKGLLSALGSFVARTWWILLIVGVLTVAWLRRGRIAKAIQ